MSRIFLDGKHVTVTRAQLVEIDAAAKKGESREDAALRVLAPAKKASPKKKGAK